MPTEHLRIAFEAQCTKDLMRKARRYAGRRARKLREVGGLADDYYISELVQDVLGDTIAGTLHWDPAAELLEDHVMDAIATRAHHDVTRAKRFPHASIDDADAAASRATMAAAETVSKPSGWVGVLESVVPFIAPAIVNAVTSGKFSIPGGLGALFDCRRASPNAGASVERTPNPTGVAPVPGPSGPAPARRAAPATRAAGPRSPASREPAPATSATESASVGEPRVSGGRAGASRDPWPVWSDTPLETTRRPPTDGMAVHGDPDHGDAADGEASLRDVSSGAQPTSGHAEVADNTAPTTTAMDALPTLDPAALAHFAAIQQALTLRESMLARALAAELTPADLRAWLSELRQMSVPDAVAKIRNLLGTVSAGTTPDSPPRMSSGGAS